MAERTHSDEYERARDAFDRLKIDDRAVFLVEATVATMARGLDDAGRALGQILDDLFQRGRSAGPQAAATPPSEDVPPHTADGPNTHTET